MKDAVPFGETDESTEYPKAAVDGLYAEAHLEELEDENMRGRIESDVSIASYESDFSVVTTESSTSVSVYDAWLEWRLDRRGDDVYTLKVEVGSFYVKSIIRKTVPQDLAKKLLEDHADNTWDYVE